MGMTNRASHMQNSLMISTTGASRPARFTFLRRVPLLLEFWNHLVIGGNSEITQRTGW